MKRLQLIDSGARFSDDRKLRYSLWRTWQPLGKSALFILLNPSTADENQDDPTVRRCINYAQDWGYDGLVVCNLFAWRASKPSDLQLPMDPMGDPENRFEILHQALKTHIIICAWGNWGRYRARNDCIRAMLEKWVPDKLHCLGLTREEEPKHVLYLPKSLTPCKLKTNGH